MPTGSNTAKSLDFVHRSQEVGPEAFLRSRSVVGRLVCSSLQVAPVSRPPSLSRYKGGSDLSRALRSPQSRAHAP